MHQLPLALVADELVTSGGAIGASSDLGEVSSQAPVLLLGPALEGVVMALVAVEAHAQEELGRVLHQQVWLSGDPVVGARRLLLSAPAGRQDGGTELVIGRVASDLAADPLAEFISSCRAEDLGVDLEEVTPAVGPVPDIGRAAEEAVDDLVSFD